MVELKNLSAGYPGTPVLEEVSLTLTAGEVTVVIGPNGCGKSTLLKTIVGICPKVGGELLLDGADLTALTPRQWAQQVAYLPQDRRTPNITAQGLVLHGRFPYLDYPRRYRSRDLELARRAMARMGVLDLAHRPMDTLSGGTRQKVYLAMALAQDTPVVLLDEPTTYLDVAHQLHLMDQARALAAEGKTMVLVLHDLTMALEGAHRLVLMNEGRVVDQGRPEEVFHSGCLERVFGVKVERVDTPSGWKYYYGEVFPSGT